MALEHPSPTCGAIGEPEPVDDADPDPDRHYERRAERELEREGDARR